MLDACPSAEQVDGLLTGQLSAISRAELEAHIDRCEVCGALIAALSGGDHPAPSAARPVMIARYEVVEAIGQGAMGTVVRARDPVLARDVAIKVLRSSIVGDGARDRLVREAQALASVTHPNVVSVFDVSMSDTESFVAMELVDGSNLREWLAEKRDTEAVLRVFHHAALGLAAAHHAGVVHRDFKPENLMVGRDGQAKVVDFGLAAPSLPEGALAEDVAVEDVGSLATRTRALIGTPSYMAPEQLAGGVADSRSDQFAFCVALYEALCGRRPFGGRTIRALRDAIAHGRPPLPRSLPSRVRSLLSRGLSADPRSRLPNMAEVAAALAPPPSRWAIAGAAGGAAALTLLVAFAVGAISERAATEPCAVGLARIRGLWGDDERTAVRAGFRASGRAHADDTFERVATGLDAYAGRLAGELGQACAATSSGEQSQIAFTLRERCLHEREEELAAVARLFRSYPSPELVDNAVRMVSSLRDVSACADLDALLAAYPLPESAEVREELQRLGGELARARLTGAGGDYASAREQAADIARRAAELEYPPLEARALFVQGEIEDPPDAAEATLRRAAQLAATAKDDLLAAQIWLALLTIVKDQPNRDDEVRALTDVVSAAIARVDSPPKLRSQLLDRRATYLLQRGDYAEARKLADTALEIAETLDDPQYLSNVLSNTGLIARRQGELEEAIRYFERAGEKKAESQGPGHPDMAAILNNLGETLRQAKRYSDARPKLERALAIRTRVFAADHPKVLAVRNSLGQLAVSEGNHPAAEAIFRALVATLEQARNPDRRVLIIYRFNLAEALMQQSEYDEAERLLAAVSADVDEFLGKDHPSAAEVQDGLARLARVRGDATGALAHYQRALGIRERTLPPDHPAIADTRADIAKLEGSQGRRAERSPGRGGRP